MSMIIVFGGIVSAMKGLDPTPASPGFMHTVKCVVAIPLLLLVLQFSEALLANDPKQWQALQSFVRSFTGQETTTTTTTTPVTDQE